MTTHLVFTIHGVTPKVGPKDVGYATPLYSYLSNKFGHAVPAVNLPERAVGDAVVPGGAKLVFRQGHYSGVLRAGGGVVPNYYRDATGNHDVDDDKMRNVVSNFMMDASSYAVTRGLPGGAHKVVLTKLAETLNFTAAQIPGPFKLTIFGQSLGVSVAMDLIHMVQRSTDPGLVHARQAVAQLKLLVTTGNNSPLLLSGLSAYPFFSVVPGMKWLNMYDPDDLIGWPVKPLLDGRPDLLAIHEDKDVNVGRWAGPAHSHYWKDNSVSSRVFQYMNA